MRTFSAAVLALTLFAVPAPAADLTAGLAAYRAGNHEQALADFMAAGEAGDAEAQWFVGNMLLDGLGVPEPDAKRAAVFYRKAAEQNYPPAQLSLGTLYRTGSGVQRDYREAIAWISKAAIAGHPVAQLDLGDLYQTGEDGRVEIANDLAVSWYSLAANQGVPEAMTKLGQMVIEGLGTVPDPITGLMWMMVAERHAKPDRQGEYRKLWQQQAAGLGKIVREEAAKKADAWKPDLYADLYVKP